jgi:predicted enzyme related to lactoylglutathione lyase
MPGDRQPPDIEPGRFAVLVDPQGAAFAVVTLNGTPA